VKLSVNLIAAGGRYYRAGEEIPGDELPAFAARYAVTGEDDAQDSSKSLGVQSHADDRPKRQFKAGKRCATVGPKKPFDCQ
jgi:hypothetical protein